MAVQEKKKEQKAKQNNNLAKTTTTTTTTISVSKNGTCAHFYQVWNLFLSACGKEKLFLSFYTTTNRLNKQKTKNKKAYFFD